MQEKPPLDTINDLLFFTVKAVDKDGGALWGKILENYKNKLKVLNVPDYAKKVDAICASDSMNPTQYSPYESFSPDVREVFKKIEQMTIYNLKSHTYNLYQELNSNSPLDSIIKYTSSKLNLLKVENNIYTRVKTGELIDYPEELLKLRAGTKEQILANPELHGQFVEQLLDRVKFLQTEEGKEFGNWEESLQKLYDENKELMKNNLSVSMQLMNIYSSELPKHKEWYNQTISLLDNLKTQLDWEAKFMQCIHNNYEYLKDSSKVKPEIAQKIVELANAMQIDSSVKVAFFNNILLPIYHGLNKIGLVTDETVKFYQEKIDTYEARKEIKSWVDKISEKPAASNAITL